MSIISAVMGAVAASSELLPLNFTSVSAYPTSGDEGDTINITPIAENFRGQTVYWTVVYGPDVSSSNFTASTGTYVVSGSSSNFYVSTIADSITQGHAWTFGINLGTTVGGSDLWTGTNTMVTINDTSLDPALVLDLDPANLDVFWTDTSGMHNDASITGIVPSGDNGGVFGFDGAASYANVPTLTTSTFGSVSVSAWINPSSIGSDQVIISKELTYKLMISADGRIAWMVKSAAGGSWTTTIFAAAGLVTTSTWSHVAATVDSNATKIYINGVLAETGSGLTLGTNDKRVVIGASDDNGTTVSGYYGGRIGEVMLWNYGTTATQVQSYYANTINRYIPQIPAFDFYNPPPSPADWPDATTSSVIATIVGSYSYDSAFGGGVVFNGDPDQYIEVQGVNYIDNTFTISMAAKLNITGSHYSPVFDGSSNDRTGTDIWANFWGDLGVGTQGETAHGNPGTVDGATVAWWDFVYSGDSVKAYKNGVEIISGTLPQPNTGWHSNLRIGNEYNQSGNVMAGTFYRIKYVKSALTAVQILDQYNSIASTYSLTPIPQSLSFNGTQYQDLHINGNTSDWALGTNGTIEWWQKTYKNSMDYTPGNFNGGIITQGNQGGSGGIDIFAAGGNIAMILGAGGASPYVVEPSTSTWVHVALSFATNPGNNNVGINHVYFNGVEQSLNNTSVALSNITDRLNIGSRVPNANYQNFTGKIFNLHISTATLYTDTFTPMIRTATTTGTVLLLSYTNPLVDLSYYELNNVTVFTAGGSYGGGERYLYIAVSSYPNLDKQVQIGNIIADHANTATFTTVKASVFLSDPDYWGIPITSLTFYASHIDISGSRHATTGTVTLSTDAPV